MDTQTLPLGLRLDDNLTSHDEEFLDTRINTFNIDLTGRNDYQALGYMLRDEANKVVAGIAGFTWGGGCEIKALWVDERWRGRGLGRLLLETAEKQAHARGATVVLLDTFDFQAPDFYPRFGYQLVGTVENYPAGHSRYYFQKPLSEPETP